MGSSKTAMVYLDGWGLGFRVAFGSAAGIGRCREPLAWPELPYGRNRLETGRPTHSFKSNRLLPAVMDWGIGDSPTYGH